MSDWGISPLLSDDERISIGRHTYGEPILKVWAESDRIEIGAFCSIADEVTILGGGEHNAEWVTTYPLRIGIGDPLAMLDGHPASKGPTRIGNDVWLGHGATVLSGVNIGDGAIVGARAVVSKDVLPYQVVAGNPARPLGFRFTPPQIEALLRIKWWEWPMERIKASAHLLCSPDIDGFIAQSG